MLLCFVFVMMFVVRLGWLFLISCVSFFMMVEILVLVCFLGRVVYRWMFLLLFVIGNGLRFMLVRIFCVMWVILVYCVSLIFGFGLRLSMSWLGWLGSLFGVKCYCGMCSLIVVICVS